MHHSLWVTFIKNNSNRFLKCLDLFEKWNHIFVTHLCLRSEAVGLSAAGKVESIETNTFSLFIIDNCSIQLTAGVCCVRPMIWWYVTKSVWIALFFFSFPGINGLPYLLLANPPSFVCLVVSQVLWWGKFSQLSPLSETVCTVCMWVCLCMCVRVYFGMCVC